MSPEEEQGLTVLDIVGVYFPVTAYSLFRPFSPILSCSVSLSPTHSQFASPPPPLSPLSPLPPSLSALPECGWPLGLASLSLCHVCNLNCGGAKQGLGHEKSFPQDQAESLKSLWTLFSEE